MKRIRPPNELILNKNEVLTGASLPLFGTAHVDLSENVDQNRPMSFRLLFCSLHFLALVFATISLVCFGVQEKKSWKKYLFRCSGVPVFRGLVMPLSMVGQSKF